MFPYLRQKGKRQRPKETRGRFNVGKTISQPPKEKESKRSMIAAYQTEKLYVG
ncbi:hypothetical protein [Staphylococcus argensis]|uniref:hypothetical protein n=1 Tax=Staphylococcus argensis TaxID=1607738 RepID=UPI00142E5E59|nr:hypothetical protein [Staphylococcus argensis]MCY6991373.1 hypothetical protein [Staphylococcus argensis]